MKKYFALLYNSRYIFFINFIEKFVFFVFFLVLARELDKTQYGLVTTVFAFTGILNSVFDFGFMFYFQREAESTNIDKEISTALNFRVLGSFIFAAFMLGYLHFWIGIDIRIIAVVGALTYIHGFNSIINSYLYGKREYRSSFISFLISRVLFALLIGAFILTKTEGIYILTSLLISVILQLFILIYYSGKAGLHFSKDFDFSNLKKIIRSSLPIGLASIFVLLYDKVDVLLIERFISLKSVAVYAIAYSVYKMFQIVSSIILTSVYTDFSRSFSNNNGLSSREIKSVFILLTFLSLLFILFIFIFGERIVVLIFSEKYLDSVQYLKFLVLALPALYLNNFTGVISNSIRKEKIPMQTTIIGAAVNVAGNFLLIMWAGIWGAVMATILTEYTVFILQAVMLFRNNKKLKFVLQ